MLIRVLDFLNTMNMHWCIGVVMQWGKSYIITWTCIYLFDEYDMVKEHEYAWIECYAFNVWMSWNACLILPYDVSAFGDMCLNAMIDEWLGLGWLCHVCMS